MFEFTPQGHLKQRTLKAVRIRDDTIHQNIRQYNEQLPAERQTEKLQVPDDL